MVYGLETDEYCVVSVYTVDDFWVGDIYANQTVSGDEGAHEDEGADCRVLEAIAAALKGAE